MLRQAKRGCAASSRKHGRRKRFELCGAGDFGAYSDAFAHDLPGRNNFGFEVDDYAARRDDDSFVRKNCERVVLACDFD